MFSYQASTPVLKSDIQIPIFLMKLVFNIFLRIHTLTDRTYVHLLDKSRVPQSCIFLTQNIYRSQRNAIHTWSSHVSRVLVKFWLWKIWASVMIYLLFASLASFCIKKSNLITIEALLWDFKIRRVKILMIHITAH